MPGQDTPLWRALDARERACLLAAYAVARENARAARWQWRVTGQRPAPENWAWLPYAPDWPLHTRLGKAGHMRLEEAGAADADPVALFAALERHGLVECRYDQTALGETLLVRLTRLGRGVARAGEDE